MPPPIPPAHFEAIVRIAAEAIISIDTNQRVLLFNRAAEAIFGYRAAEVLGQPLRLLLPATASAAHDRHVQRFAESGVSARLMGERQPVEGRRKNGEQFPAEVSISHVRIDSESFFTAIVRDISERRQIELERQTLLLREREARALAERANRQAAFLARATAALDTSLDYEKTLDELCRLCVPELGAVCIIDVLSEDGSVRRVAACHDLVGGERTAAALMRYPSDLSRPFLTRASVLDGRAVLQANLRDDDLQGIVHDEDHLAIWRAIGPTSYVTAPLSVAGRILGAIAVVTASGRRRYDDDDLAVLTALAVRAALAIDNARLYAAARRASALRDEALGVVSHDLRNPLATVSMALTGLEDEASTTPSRRAELVRIGRTSVSWMERMIQDLLDIASIDAGKLSVERARTDLVITLVRAKETFEDMFSDRRIGLDFEIPEHLPVVYADGDRILQLLGNLLANAAKFTPEQGHVAVATQLGSDEIVVSVRDTGPGIPPDHLPYLFQRFWHGRRGAGTRGTGLGLSIAKGIADAHQGRIWVESAPGQGSTFFFTLPLANAAVAGDASPPPVIAPRALRVVGGESGSTRHSSA